MMRLAYPSFLLILLLIIPMVYYGRHAGGRIRFSSLKIFKDMSISTNFHPRQILLILRALVIVLFIIALARPQSGRKFTEIQSDGVDIVLVIDTSGSMKALDFKKHGKNVDRLSVVKDVVEDFVKKRPGDRLGLIVFGEDAYTQCPLTLDHGILLEFLNKTEIGMAGEATAIGSAIGVGVNRMKDLKSKSKVMILITDGRSNVGRIPPLKAAELAKTFGIKIYSIGVGTKGKAPFLVNGLFGKTYQYQKVDLDEPTLKAIASTTGGRYFRATETKELENIYGEIDNLEKTEIKVKEYTEYNEIFHYFLLPGMLLLLLEILLGQTRFRKIP